MTEVYKGNRHDVTVDADDMTIGATEAPVRISLNPEVLKQLPPHECLALAQNITDENIVRARREAIMGALATSGHRELASLQDIFRIASEQMRDRDSVLSRAPSTVSSAGTFVIPDGQSSSARTLPGAQPAAASSEATAVPREAPVPLGRAALSGFIKICSNVWSGVVNLFKKFRGVNPARVAPAAEPSGDVNPTVVQVTPALVASVQSHDISYAPSGRRSSVTSSIVSDLDNRSEGLSAEGSPSTPGSPRGDNGSEVGSIMPGMSVRSASAGRLVPAQQLPTQPGMQGGRAG